MTLDGWWLDTRYALRALRRQPAFAAVAVLMLTVGIGGTTGIYTLAHRLLLSPLPGLSEPEELVAVGITSPGSSFRTFSHPAYEMLRDGVDTFDGVVATSRIALDLRTDGPPERLAGEIVSGDYFDVLGVRFAAGRGFAADETATLGGPLVAVVSHRAWLDRYGLDPGLVGREISLNGAPFTVVGVTAPDFVGLSIAGPAPEVWVPLSTQPTAMPAADWDPLRSTGDFWLSVVARLSDGVTVARATAEADAWMAGLRAAAPGTLDDFGIRVTPDVALPHPAERREVVTLLAVLLTVVGLVLAIVCSNLANLLLSRAATRRHEVGIRMALGSGRGRVMRQLLVESAVLALAGGALGLFLAAPVASLVLRVAGESLAIEVRPDATVALFALLLAAGTGLLFGLAPALDASRPDPAGSIGPTRGGGRADSTRLRRVLAVAQVALSALLLVESALLVRSLGRMTGIDPGFDPTNLVAARVDLRPLRLSEDEGRALYRTVIDRVEALPGIRAATLSLNAPLAGAWRGGSFLVEGRGEERFDAPYNVLWPGYFETMGVPLLRGRDFTLADDASAPPVAIVTASFARRFWPAGSAIGRRILRGGPDAPPIEIVGVVGDSKFGSLAEAPQPFFFRPLLQRFEGRAEVIVRTSANPADLVPALRAELRAVDPDLPSLRIRTLASLVDGSMADQRLAASVTGGFTGLAVLLAALGLYGLLSYGVTRRTREIGVRLALGADGAEVTRMITREGLALTGVGLLIGLTAAAGATRLTRSLLFGVDTLDPVAFVSAAAILSAVAAAACWLPARRASRVDPVEALRYE